MLLTPKQNPAAFSREIVRALVEGLPVEPPDEEFYRRRAACFVSIKRDARLRGCIGTLEPVEKELGLELVRNARSAAFADPRFSPVGGDELPYLSFSVDVLSRSEAVESNSELDCEKYGVIVSCDYRRGVLLPDLEGVTSVEHQLSIACQKAGISPHEQFGIERFMVDRYHEE
ncbi:MAG: AmmeMemoRadiSam system protein A [Thermoleophilia bacterium]|nr:AmmeMemoRadiSam system protein A [Thermoleophilia bacterium]